MTVHEPLSKPEREQLRDVMAVLRAGTIPQQTLQQAETALSSGQDTRSGELG